MVMTLFRKLVRNLVVLKCGGASRRHLCNVPKIFCLHHFGFEIEEHGAKHELRGISENKKKTIINE